MQTNGAKNYGNGRAEIRLVDGLHYRRDAFADGLSRLGFDVCGPNTLQPTAADVLVLWNRYARDESRARLYEQAGGTVLVTENAWLGPEEKDRHLFALCRSHHNGAGSWEVGAEDRWSRLSIPLKPWREDGDHILILPQRGMGEDGVRQPRLWEYEICVRLRHLTKMPFKFRKHPGNRPHPEIDWSGVYACVTWASGAALKAIVAGVPVFYDFPLWIGGASAFCGIADLDYCFRGDRLPMLNRLAWAQWSAEEIGSGEPFKWLLKLR